MILVEALEPVAISHGYELVDVEVVGQGSAAIVRVYLDQPNGLDIDSLAEANAWVGTEVERINPFPGSYTLEVSSPGIDRPLRTREHFRRFVGETVALQGEPVDGRAKWTGILQGMDGDTVLLEVDGQTVRLDFPWIRKAHVKGRVDFKKGRKDD
jgi:ribosome maturation factor RimP